MPVVLSGRCATIIDTAIDAKNILAPKSDFLFPALRGSGFYNSVNQDEVLGVGCHALRRFHTSACIQAGVDLIFTKSLLNHTTTGDVPMSSYVSLPLTARTVAAQRVADFIKTRLMGLSAGAAQALPLLGFQPAEASNLRSRSVSA
jgi:integrase